MGRNNFIPRGRGRKVGPVLHIYCEGETEEAYLNAYIRFNKYSRCEIERSHHTDPVGLVEEAIKNKNSAPNSDIFWVVYDQEDNSQENKLRLHEEAYQKALSQGIQIALSAINIEIWLLLHFTPTPKRCNNTTQATHELKRYLPHYTKGDSNIFDKLQQHISKARKNAANLLARQQRAHPDEKAYNLNPCTSFHLLLDAIDQIK